MGNVFKNIRPDGLKLRDEVDLMYMISASLQGICAKLDDDGGVPKTTYEANCITALMNFVIKDSKGNRFQSVATPSSTLEPVHIIGPVSISDSARQAWLYQIYNVIETLTEQLDGDSLSGTNFEANVYTAIILDRVRNKFGNQLGNGTSFTFKQGSMPIKEWIDALYNICDAIETLTEQLDADGTVTDITYEALWFTATILLRISNSKGSAIGVSRNA